MPAYDVIVFQAVYFVVLCYELIGFFVENLAELVGNIDGTWESMYSSWGKKNVIGYVLLVKKV